MVSICLPAHKELFNREFDLLQVHLNLCQSVQFSTRTGFCWPPSKLCNIWFLLPVWLTEDLFGCLFATPMLCHHYIIRDLRGLSYPRCINLNLLLLFFHSFIHFHGQSPAASWLLLPLSLFRCVHHDVQTSPSSDEEAQSDRSYKPPEEPEDPGSWRWGWRRWSAPLKGQITSCDVLFISAFLFSFQDAFAHQSA